MKFITEEDLRDLYRKEPFTAYEIEPGARLTPGARQFLVDRGINMFDNGSGINKNTGNTKQEAAISEAKKGLHRKKLHGRMRSIEALFLLTGEELMSGDAVLAQTVISLGKQFVSVLNVLEGKGTAENLSCKECTGIKEANFSDELGDCFEITEVHMQLKKGRDIIILHRLRCSLHEIQPDILELYEGSKEENERCKDVIGKVNQIINSLSQMICAVVGGKTCQKTS